MSQTWESVKLQYWHDLAILSSPLGVYTVVLTEHGRYAAQRKHPLNLCPRRFREPQLIYFVAVYLYVLAALSYPVQIKPLDEVKAVAAGGELLAESFVYCVAGGLGKTPVGPSTRGSLVVYYATRCISVEQCSSAGDLMASCALLMTNVILHVFPRQVPCCHLLIARLLRPRTLPTKQGV